MSAMETATAMLLGATKMMTRVDVDKDSRKLRILFADGCVAMVPVADIEEAGKPVTLDLNRVELPDPYVLLIANSEGGIEDVPWDFVRHYCDSQFTRIEKRKAELSRKALGKRIAQLRREAGMTQGELAASSSISRATINRIEQGKMYSRTLTLQRIAKALKASLVDLLTSSWGSSSFGIDEPLIHVQASRKESKKAAR